MTVKTGKSLTEIWCIDSFLH